MRISDWSSDVCSSDLFDLFSDLSKDPQIYPAYNSTVAADAQEQTLRTITQLLVKQDGDYRDLFTTRDAWLTRALGVVYRVPVATRNGWERSEEHTSELQSLMRISYAVFCLKTKKTPNI